MPRPDPDRLDEDLARLRELGVTVLVSALTEVEQDAYGLAAEPERARAAGLEFVALPVPDFGVPDPDAARPVLAELRQRLAGGGHVLVHCLGGIGRSSTLAAGILVLEGVDPSAAFDAITEARGLPVPETEAQRAWPGLL
jgi:protein-tyrosine phosphatase